MEKIAAEAGSVISASLLGALAGSGALPFPRESYEQTIAASGRGVKASLVAFAGAFEARATAQRGRRSVRAERRAGSARPEPAAPAGRDERQRPGPRCSTAGSRCRRASSAYPEPMRDMAARGLNKVVDFQDVAYGRRISRPARPGGRRSTMRRHGYRAVDRRGKTSRQRHVL